MTEDPKLPSAPPLLAVHPEPEWAHSAIIERLRARVVVDDRAAAQFWEHEARVTPIVEADGEAGWAVVSFVWRDQDAADVLLEVNKITHTLEHGRMEHIEGTDVWFRTLRLRTDWRGSYAFLPLREGEFAALAAMDRRPAMIDARRRSVPDPRNPRAEHAHGGRALSVAELADAPPQPWIHREGHPLPEGRLSELRVPGGRRVWTYEPAALARSADQARHPIVVVLDGELWLERKHVVATVEALSEAGAIRTPFVVFVDNGGIPKRIGELSFDGGTDAFIAEDLLPWARERLPISADPADVVVIGQSLGGLTALKTAFDHPDAVGGAIAQSSSLWQHDLLDRACAASPGRPQLWIEVGQHEPVLLGGHRRLCEALSAAGAPPRGYVEFNGGHDAACWRGGIADGLRALLPA